MPTPSYLYLQDASGQWWELNANTDGSLATTSISGPPTPPTPSSTSGPSSTFTVSYALDWARRFAYNRPALLGNGIEPAITNANLILQTVLGPPFRWRWNRVKTGFITKVGQQDYTLFNWTALTTVYVGYVLVDNFGNSQMVTAVTGSQETGSSYPVFNSTTGGNTSDGQVTWTNNGSIGVQPISPTYTFNWLETVAVQDVNQSTPTWHEFSPRIGLSEDSEQARPGNVAAQYDDGNGNVTFRLMPVPDAAYPVVLTVQKKPPVLTKVSQTWAPIPDEYARLYLWGFLSLMLLFADDARFAQTNQKFTAAVLAASEGLTETERNIWLNDWQSITGDPMHRAQMLQQGSQARGV